MASSDTMATPSLSLKHPPSFLLQPPPFTPRELLVSFRGRKVESGVVAEGPSGYRQASRAGPLRPPVLSQFRGSSGAGPFCVVFAFPGNDPSLSVGGTRGKRAAWWGSCGSETRGAWRRSESKGIPFLLPSNWANAGARPFGGRGWAGLQTPIAGISPRTTRYGLFQASRTTRRTLNPLRVPALNRDVLARGHPYGRH